MGNYWCKKKDRILVDPYFQKAEYPLLQEATFQDGDMIVTESARSMKTYLRCKYCHIEPESLKGEITLLNLPPPIGHMYVKYKNKEGLIPLPKGLHTKSTILYYTKDDDRLVKFYDGLYVFTGFVDQHIDDNYMKDENTPRMFSSIFVCVLDFNQDLYQVYTGESTCNTAEYDYGRYKVVKIHASARCAMMKVLSTDPEKVEVKCWFQLVG
jgi:hypothetical protein